MRLVYPQGALRIESLRVYSGSEEFTSKMRVELVQAIPAMLSGR